MEVLINTPTIADLIYRGEVGLLKDAMARPNDVGMQTFDQSLVKLYMDGMIEYEDAIRGADSQNDLRLAIKMECMKRGLEDPGSKAEAASQWRIGGNA